MGQLLSENWLLILGGAVALGIWAYRTLSKQSAELKLQRLLLIQDLAQSAYLAVHALAAGTSTRIDDKVAAALKRVAETLSAQTGKPLTEAEKQLANMRLLATAAKVQLGSLTPPSQ